MITNQTRKTTVAETPWLAAGLIWRMRGMIGRTFDPFDALIFERNNGIHMFFMSMPLDVLFLDKEGCVVDLRVGLKPWRMAWKWGARTVIELPTGAIAASRTEHGDHLQVQADKKV